eukprot:scaffold2029_cov181-Amphora_coffeaeformis.AAC.5
MTMTKNREQRPSFFLVSSKLEVSFDSNIKTMRVFHLLSHSILLLTKVSGFTTGLALRTTTTATTKSPKPRFSSSSWHHENNLARQHASSHVQLASSNDENDDNMVTISNESDQIILGVFGTVASLIVFGSEYVLATTGCGLPAGPLGLFGLAEGVSYLGVVGLVGFSLVKKVKTGCGLPAGPGGLLGAAEGLSFFAIAAGLVVLVLQVTNYGYIPNAVPMEGGMCS